MNKYTRLNFFDNILHYRVYKHEDTRLILAFLRTEYTQFIKGKEFKLYSILEKNLKINIGLKSHFDLNDNCPVNETLLFIDLK